MSIAVLLLTHLLLKVSQKKILKITWFDLLLLWLKANYVKQ